MIKKKCIRLNVDFLNRFLPVDVDIPPQTLFDINPTYPKLSPDEWAIKSMDTSSKSMDNKTNMLFLTYLNDNRLQEIFRLIYWHKSVYLIFIWAFAILVGFSIFITVILLSRDKKFFSKTNNRTKSITVGGETSSLSGWLTKRRFQQYDQDDGDQSENKRLTEKHQWASSSEESDLSDNDVFDVTNFQNVTLRN